MGLVGYGDFRQAVRRHAPSELIRFLSARAAEHQPLVMEWDDNWASGHPPWVYAAIARESILYGNEYRRAPVDEQAFLRLRNLMTESHDPRPERDMNMVSLMGSYLYEQLPYQASMMDEISRAHLLMAGTGETIPGTPTDADWRSLLGGTIEESLAASFVIYVGVMKSGFFDTAWFDETWMQAIVEVVPEEVMKAVLNLLSTTVDEAKEDARGVPALPRHLQRFGYNPLIRTPLIDLGDGKRYAPQPQFILRSMSTENLYYRGIRTWDDSFAAALGMQVQEYTGRQLRHTGLLEVVEEFRWFKNKRGGLDSSDWFVITPQRTILIECKSARMAMAAKAGSVDALTQANGVLGKAYSQLGANAAEIRGGNPAFAHIPADRPLVGLVVTAEPFHMANAGPVRDSLPDPGLPVLTVSLHEVEVLSVLTPDELGTSLDRIVNDRELYEQSLLRSLSTLLPLDRERHDNRLIRETFDRVFLPLTGRRTPKTEVEPRGAGVP